MKTITLKYAGEDFWGTPVYETPNGALLKDLNHGNGELFLHTVAGDGFDAEPCMPIARIKQYQAVTFEITGKDEQEPTPEEKFNYQLLSRLQADCDFFLGHGNCCEKRLWANSVNGQIEKMKELYNSFAHDKKPEWLKYEEIVEYEKKMESTLNPVPERTK